MMIRLMIKVGASVATLLALGSMPAQANSVFSQAELSTIWEHELAYSSSSDDMQKIESVIEPELNLPLSRVELTAIARIRLDTEADLGPSVRKPSNYSRRNGPLYTGRHGELTLRELYLDAQWLGGFWRIGKQQVVWGQADGLKVLDKVNPQSFREFILDDFEDSRIPLWMINLEMPIEDGIIQLLWIPDATSHELPEIGTPFEFSSREFIPRLPTGSNGVPKLPVLLNKTPTPGRFFRDSDLGLRYSRFTESGWDVTLNYLYQYLDLPVLYQDVVGSGPATRIDVSPTLKRSHVVGGTLSNAFGSVTLRAEAGYISDTYHISKNQLTRGIARSPELSSVVGFDYQGLDDTLISLQWFQSHLIDYDAQILRAQTGQSVTLLLQRNYANETWQAGLLMIHSLTQEDGLIQPRLSHQLRSNIELWGGADLFYGDHEGLFGQFDRQDRFLAGFQFGF